MQEIYTSMEYRKFISEDITSGVNKITYLGYADYESNPLIRDKRLTFRDSADFANPIWRIKKIVENTTTKVTETFYPKGDASKTYAWDERATLDYI